MPRRKKRVTAKRGARKAPRKATRAKGVKRAPRAAAPIAADAAQALAGLQAYATQLVQQRAAIDVQLETVEKALSVLGKPMPAIAARPAARVGGKRATGGHRPGSLKDFIQRVLSGGGVMTVKDITESVMAAGYETANKTLAKSVGIALSQMKSVKKIARGQFQLK